MHRIFLPRAHAENLVGFCKRHGLSRFRVANDYGVYVGQTHGKEQCLYFFPGCDPAENPYWRDRVRDWLWNLEICDLLEVSLLEEVLAEDLSYDHICIQIDMLGTVIQGMSPRPQYPAGMPHYRPRYIPAGRR